MDYPQRGQLLIEVDEVPEQLIEETPDSETLLLDRIRQGDESAFTRLVSDHLTQVINLAYRMLGDRQEAEDLAQEAFIRLHRALPSFRGDCRIKTWLYRVVSRLVIDHLRREQVRRRIFFFRKSEDDPDRGRQLCRSGGIAQRSIAGGRSPRKIVQSYDETFRKAARCFCATTPGRLAPEGNSNSAPSQGRYGQGSFASGCAVFTSGIYRR